MNFALFQILPKSILHQVLPRMGDTIGVHARVGRVNPLLLANQMVFSFPRHVHRTGFLVSALVIHWKQYMSASVGDISWFWRTVKFVNKCRL